MSFLGFFFSLQEVYHFKRMSELDAIVTFWQDSVYYHPSHYFECLCSALDIESTFWSASNKLDQFANGAMSLLSNSYRNNSRMEDHLFWKVIISSWWVSRPSSLNVMWSRPLMLSVISQPGLYFVWSILIHPHQPWSLLLNVSSSLFSSHGCLVASMLFVPSAPYRESPLTLV